MTDVRGMCCLCGGWVSEESADRCVFCAADLCAKCHKRSNQCGECLHDGYKPKNTSSEWVRYVKSKTEELHRRNVQSAVPVKEDEYKTDKVFSRFQNVSLTFSSYTKMLEACKAVENWPDSIKTMLKLRLEYDAHFRAVDSK